MDVVVDGKSQGAVSKYTFTNVRTNHTISATFKSRTFTVRASAGEGGEISPSGEVPAVWGSDLTFTISANEGYKVLDVLVDGESQGAISTYSFTKISSDHTIGATFIPISYTITAIAGAGGEITPSGEVPVMVETIKVS